MRKIAAIASMLIGALFLTSLLAVPVSAIQADAPDYEEGDGWGVGQELSLDWKWSDMTALEKAAVEEMLASMGMEVGELGLTADAAFYAMLKVTDVTDDEYVMNAKMAIKVAATGNIDATGEMPKAGSYNITVADVYDDFDWDYFYDPDYAAMGIDMEEKTVSVDLAVDLAIILEGTIHMEKENLAIKSVDLSLNAAAVISFKAVNIPQIDTDYVYDYDVSYWEPAYILVDASYSNYDVEVKAVLDASLSMEFEPALNIFEFPMEAGNTWAIDSEATISGELSGFLDAKGLPEEVEEAMLEEMGFTGFPITFDNLELGDVEIKDGKLEPITVPVQADMECTGQTTVDIFGSERTVFVIEADTGDGAMEFYYSPDLLDIFASIAMLDMGDLPFDIDELEAIGVMFENKDVTADEADAEIESIKSYESSVANKASGSEFPVMIIVAFLAVLAVAVVAVLFFIRKK